MEGRGRQRVLWILIFLGVPLAFTSRVILKYEGLFNRQQNMARKHVEGRAEAHESLSVLCPRSCVSWETPTCMAPRR